MSAEAKKKKIDYERERREILSRKFEELGQLLVGMGMDKREVSTQVDTLSSAIDALRELKQKQENEMSMPPTKKARLRFTGSYWMPLRQSDLIRSSSRLLSGSSRRYDDLNSRTYAGVKEESYSGLDALILPEPHFHLSRAPINPPAPVWHNVQFTHVKNDAVHPYSPGRLSAYPSSSSRPQNSSSGYHPDALLLLQSTRPAQPPPLSFHSPHYVDDSTSSDHVSSPGTLEISRDQSQIPVPTTSDFCSIYSHHRTISGDSLAPMPSSPNRDSFSFMLPHRGSAAFQ